MARSGGFEPPTAWFVARYSIQLSYERANDHFFRTFKVRTLPLIKPLADSRSNQRNGPLGRIRTSDRLVRSQVLYPAELRAGNNVAEKEGFEPSIELQTLYSLSRGAPSASRPPLHIQNF